MHVRHCEPPAIGSSSVRSRYAQGGDSRGARLKIAEREDDLSIRLASAGGGTRAVRAYKPTHEPDSRVVGNWQSEPADHGAVA